MMVGPFGSLFARGEQIGYLPHWAENDYDTRYLDEEEGFVTSSTTEVTNCLFWSKTNPDKLRSLHSVPCPTRSLILHLCGPDMKSDEVVFELLKEFDKKEKSYVDQEAS